MSKITTIYLPGGVEHEVYHQPFANTEIQGDKGVRPSLTHYEDGLDWNKKFREHKIEANSSTQEYALREVTPQRSNRIWVLGIADIHWGNTGVDYEMVDKLFKTLETTPDTYAIFGWNLVDAAIAGKFADGLTESGMTVQEQVYTLKDKIDRLAKQNKILGAIGMGSCHEGWMKQKADWNIYRELFQDTDVPLLLNGGYLDIKVGKETYRTAHFHKLKYFSTFNKTHGGDRAMDRLTDAEVVFTSHLHQAATGQTERYNAPFRKETAVLSLGSCKLDDRFARANMGKDGERPGQGIMLWSDYHWKQTTFNLETGEEMMRDSIKARESERIDQLREELKAMK